MIILYYKGNNTLQITDPDDAIERIYYLEASIPKISQVESYLKLHTSPNDIILYFDKYGIKYGIKKIKIKLSKIDNQIPLYDIFSENIYLISKFNVYNRVTYQHYRFPTKNFLNKLIARKEELKKQQDTLDILQKRKYKKLSLIIPFLKSFDLDILYRTYISVFYLYANEVGKNITTCKRPSFISHLTHINPYYTRSEVINTALNMGIKLEEKYYEQEDINKLCDIISANDISAKTLLQHQKYITKKSQVGLVQYYTLQGSFFMNQYLRNMTSYNYKNEFLENIITSMWDLIIKSPSFDKSYILYRFISNDGYLKHLKIGDMYTEPGFTSTTRDPFYRSDLYKFGFILIKINIPKDIVGVALCVETISHFPEEQEIILAPLTIMRLDKRDENIAYFHTDYNFRTQIKTLYEFTYIGKRSISFAERPLYPQTKTINFMELENIDTVTLEEKIRYFINKYVNPMFQFSSVIGDNKYTIIVERYDSTGAYKKFYAVKNQNGFSMYTLHNDYVLFMIELGEDQTTNERYMHVNYYVKYSVLDREKIFGDENFMRFISSVAYFFSITMVIVWADYKACAERLNLNNDQEGGVVQRGFVGKMVKGLKEQEDKVKEESEQLTGIPKTQEYLGGSYCHDFYTYLKNKTKRYSNSKILNIELQPKFSYHQLDKLKTVKYDMILKKDDQDEIYQIFNKVYLSTRRASHDMADFYVWLVDNKCYLVETLIFKMERFFRIDNPFNNDYYILDPITFLYNRKYIQTFPTFVARTTTVVLKDSKTTMPKNEYRITSTRQMYTR